MPRSSCRGSEMPPQQRQQSPRAPLHLKTTTTTSSTDSNGAHRPVRDRSPKLEEHRRSPRSPLPELGVCSQKKRGTRVADLETRLGHAQEELRKLKEKLASAETARKETQQQLEETKKLVQPAATAPAEEPPQEEKEQDQQQPQELKTGSDDEEKGGGARDSESPAEQADSSEARAADVSDSVENEKGEEETKLEEETTTKAAPVDEPEEVTSSKPTEREQEAPIANVKEPTLEIMSELELCQAENASLKQQLAAAESNAAAVQAKDEDLLLKLKTATEELEQSRANAGQLAEQLEATEEAKAALEAEMKRLRIQTDQWRKAADAAAAIISGDEGLRLDTNSGVRGSSRAAGRCGSMDKQQHVGHDAGLLGSPLLSGEELLDGGYGGGKRKSGGIRMFGDLWKKRGNQK